ncbi:flippase [Patescibacteria group bacterium]|nr:flippase [Patescibacteria group bacterium]
MSIAKQIAKNTFYLGLGKILSTGLGVLTIALLLRYLSPDDYGRYTTVLAFILLFGTFVDFGLNLTTTQDISLPKTDVARTLSSIFTLRLIVNIVLVLLLPIILLAFPYEADVKNAILISSVLFFTYSLFQVLASYFQKTLQAGKVAFAELIGRIVLLATTMLAIYFKFSFLEIMLTIVASSLAQFWMLLRFTSQAINLRLTIDTQIWKRIMTKTWPIALSVIFTTIYFKGDAIILSLTRPYADVGIYGAAYKILEVLITLPILFMGLILPYLSHSFASHDTNRFNKTIQKAWDALSLVTIPIVIGTLVLAQPIMMLIAGDKYQNSVVVLRILIIAAGIIFLGSLFTHAIVAVNQQKHMIKYYAFAAVLAVALYIIYIPTYTYYAAAAVTVLAEALIAIAAFIKVRQTAHLSLSMHIFFKAFILSAVMGTILYVLQDLYILILLALGAIIYLGLILITNTYTSLMTYENNPQDK